LESAKRKIKKFWYGTDTSTERKNEREKSKKKEQRRVKKSISRA
jgi:hypothetical protein